MSVTHELRLAVITLSAHVPDLADQEGWDEALRLRDLVHGLRVGGYQIVGVLGADAQLPDKLNALAPDVLIVDAESGARDAIEHVVWATRDAPRPIVLFTEEHDPAHMREAVAAGVVAYVVAGLAPERVRPIIDVAIARFEHEQGLRGELARAKGQLAERVVVDRAKAMLMQRHGLLEPQAYARLRTTAMNQGLTIHEVARRLLELADLFT
ncbi:ANTAR domain-containing response regulator [Ideonella sp.]|uniref:ANTAR domain-containing response regulator n=1 Tax=Ideonella sp. TaxID=1929293 RepID=UPI002B486A5A|nr:ANTAR domain-containing protein [Ideonella sp.]HJV69454.1 ANTAR domain-containing protein [Ideonella sp.]